MYQIHLQPKDKTSIPQCAFGAACTRKGCVYRHPKKGERVVVSEDAPVCAPFVIGQCKFGNKCRNRHVSGEEADRIRERNAKTPCRYGSRCTTLDCLFTHPPPEPCRFGLQCTNVNCRYLHPEPEDREVGESSAIGTEGLHSNDPSGPTVRFPMSEALKKKYDDGSIYTQTRSWHPTVRVPEEVWVHGWARNPSAYRQYSDPYDRFIAVNAISPRGVIDLHFLTVEEVIPVLQAVLGKQIGWNWQFYDDEARNVWIVTGIGSHTLQKGRTLLYDVVYDYLEKSGANFKIAKDSHDNAGGFLLTL